ncbi:pyridoxamine 5'-phosphate oxidase family protein [Curvivirga aplysinae]|uniref:pyridoxamine 5'-phosphate oxidase family protein n=1 Tax=Curvivirga aplysinae TaxID=2529852 RepID=UPI001C3FB939|nr:pyridoxamine 5'-phosphate oxidase family protein [Curvivirga aplysinae]
MTEIKKDSLYPITSRNQLKRAHQRGSYNAQDVYDILDASYLCHVGYVIDDQPYVTPTIHWRVGNKIYWHGSSASRMMKSATMGMPVSLTVTLFDGLVLARSAFKHSANYRSAMVFGTASMITDRDQKVEALNQMIEHLYPGRLSELREHHEQEIKATMVAVMEIEEASAKIRNAPAEDDLEDIEKIDAWTGIVPRHEIWDAAIPDHTQLKDRPSPKYLNKLYSL